MGRVREMDEPCSKVLINELTKTCKFLLGQGVNGAKMWSSAFVQDDIEIIQLMVSQLSSLIFAEHVHKVMTVFRNSAHVDQNLGSGHRVTMTLGSEIWSCKYS